MDVDHAEKPITTIGTGDASVIVGTRTDLMIIDVIGGIAATGELTGTMTGVIAIGTTVEPGLAAADRVSHLLLVQKNRATAKGRDFFLLETKLLSYSCSRL